MTATPATKDGAPETRRFEAEVQELLGLMIHSLYTEREIFLRELISNASDALDKLRLRALTEDGLLGDDETLAIELEPNAEARTLTVSDNGIGMDRDELASNLGTIARSGTRAFLSQLKDAKDAQEGGQAQLIGQFGVGFYASFMVADEVEVISRKAGEEQAYRWRSKADGTYTLETAERAERGTSVILHLKAAEPTESDFVDYTAARVLEDVVRRHADFVEHPVRMDVETWEIERDDEGKPVEDGERTKSVTTKTLNSQRPLWARKKGEIEDAEAADLYRHLTSDWNPPLRTLHLQAEVPVDYKALLFVPKERPFDMLHAGPEAKSRIALYVRRVLIMPECQDLLPTWLRFVRGAVESDDLPLNVSRQTLQANPVTKRIGKHLVTKLLADLATLLREDRAAYEGFFEAFGSILKEGIAQGDDDDHRISSLCLFPGLQSEQPMTLDAYIEAKPDDQEAIYAITGTSIEALKASPHLEAYRKRGTEVLLLAEPVDEWVVARMTTYRDVPIKLVSQGAAELEDDDAKATREAQQEEHKDLLTALQSILDDYVQEVRFTSRLEDSPAVLVSEEGAPGPTMERVMREMHGHAPATKRILELNPKHEVVARLEALHGEGPEGAALTDLAHLLHGQALLAEGSPLPDPAAFSRLLGRLLVPSSS